MNEMQLFLIFVTFGVTAIIAGFRSHWNAFAVMVAVAFFAAWGFVWRLIQ